MSGSVWLVDPLCGTLNYAVRTTLVAVNVALRAGSEIAVAASADPFADEVFWTDGTRAYMRCHGVDEQLTPSCWHGVTTVIAGNCGFSLAPLRPSHRDLMGETLQNVEDMRLLADTGFIERFRPRVVSTTLAVAWVAAGRRAAYVTDGDLRDSVHFASGIALCRAAGCVVTGIQGQPLHTGAGGLIAAADHQTHADLMALIRNQLSLGR